MRRLINLEQKLKTLFEYQRFENNPRLGKIIEESENRGCVELSDEALFMVAAAGEIEDSAEKK